MSSARSILLLMLSGLSLVGCQNKPEQSDEANLATASEQDVAAIRQRYLSANANHRVGVVVAVMSDAKLVAVGDIPVQDFGINDVMTFLDADEQPVASGTVVNATASELHLRYTEKTRAPRVGDLAVRLAL